MTPEASAAYNAAKGAAREQPSEPRDECDAVGAGGLHCCLYTPHHGAHYDARHNRFFTVLEPGDTR